MSKNFLQPGDKVKMRDGTILTVEGLEFREFTAKECSWFIPKKEIEEVIEDSVDGLDHNYCEPKE
jgi:hypothetical protein